MSQRNSLWVDATTWKDRWDVVTKIQSGGQGEAFEVIRKSDKRRGFLKVVKSRSDPERRARFSRESNAYDTFSIPHVPRLIESNAHLHAEPTYTPFLIVDFIEGPTLGKWREQQIKVSLATGVELTRRLLETLADCHAKSLVHRDVKPDNIILENGDPALPWLLDFGLNHHEMPEMNFATEQGQEIGNRFLRLPELSAGSLLKQDPRSDVSFAAGILFFVLTGQAPHVLVDGEGKLPHQRLQANPLLQAVGGDRYQRLASIFDRSFAPRLEERYSNAAILRDHLNRLMQDHPVALSIEAEIAELAARLDTPRNQNRVHVVGAIRTGLSKVQNVFRELLARIDRSLTYAQTNFIVTPEAGSNTIKLGQLESPDWLRSITYEIKVSGDELVLMFSDENIFRTNISSPQWDENFDSIVSRWLMREIRLAFDSNAMPPEVAHFKDVPPFSTLELAAVEARRSNRKILAFVYDPTQDKRGKLDHALGYFLENRKTRDVMNTTFVTALVPLSQLLQVSEILNGASMETSRWVVLDEDLHALQEAVIYANPQVAERIVGELSTQYGASFRG